LGENILEEIQRALGNSAEDIQEGFKEIWRILRLRLYKRPDIRIIQREGLRHQYEVPLSESMVVF
jgi:hypothetical protein